MGRVPFQRSNDQASNSAMPVPGWLPSNDPGYQTQKLCVRLYLDANQAISNDTWMAIPMVPDTDVNLGGYCTITFL